MFHHSSHSGSDIAKTELADLQNEIEQARMVLTLLHEGTMAAKRSRNGQRTTELLAANEQLVVAALRAQTTAEAATRKLKQIARAAEVDALTGLHNRVSLQDRFDYAVAIAKRVGTRLALLFIDLDNFKQINDTLGHAVGDQVLRVAAKRLAAAVRGSDIVSRHGGDEFLVLVTDVSYTADVIQIALKLLSALGLPLRIGADVLRLAASIGISSFPEDGEDASTLIHRADAAMYRAKRSGGGGFAFHGSTALDSVSAEPRARAALHYPLTHYRAALAEQARRYTQLRDANEQLVLATLDAQTLRDAAEHTERCQKNFLAVLAHELRNPLASIQQAAALLHPGRMDEALLRRIQGIIERQVSQMARLVTDLLDVARITSGKLRLERQPVDLNTIVDEAVDACRPGMDARLQHLTVRCPPDPVELHGDPVRLAQILSNLLDNATNFTKEGGYIRISVVTDPASISIAISDTGIGMSPESSSTIFEPFMQDINAIGLNGAGLGIGLAVVRELVVAHGGTISASSAGIGLGSTFVVTLPRLHGTAAVNVPMAGS
ncbi:MAG: diguanylate cyclase [Pseudomonadota bacterium]|nr:diguanylate cyclase [Pseudomonadota bacterium]